MMMMKGWGGESGGGGVGRTRLLSSCLWACGRAGTDACVHASIREWAHACMFICACTCEQGGRAGGRAARHTCVHVCLCARARACTFVLAWVYEHARACTVHACMHMYAGMRTCGYAGICACVHVCVAHPERYAQQWHGANCRQRKHTHSGMHART